MGWWQQHEGTPVSSGRAWLLTENRVNAGPLQTSLCFPTTAVIGRVASVLKMAGRRLLPRSTSVWVWLRWCNPSILVGSTSDGLSVSLCLSMARNWHHTCLSFTFCIHILELHLHVLHLLLQADTIHATWVKTKDIAYKSRSCHTQPIFSSQSFSTDRHKLGTSHPLC